MKLRLCILISVACLITPATAQRSTNTVQTLTDADADGVTQVAAGRYVIINLPINSSQGFAWNVMKVTNASPDPIRMIPNPAGGPAMLGAPEVASLRVGFRRAGRASLVLGLMPPGAGRGPEEVLHYHFEVTNGAVELRR